MNKKLLKKQLGDLEPGDLILVEWSDASVGKSLSTGLGIDLPVKSWGVFVSILGKRRKHIILAQNCFQYSNGLYDLDYTAIPLSWTEQVKILMKNHVTQETAEILLRSFIQGGRTSFKRRKQQKVRNHGSH